MECRPAAEEREAPPSSAWLRKTCCVRARRSILVVRVGTGVSNCDCKGWSGGDHADTVLRQRGGQHGGVKGVLPTAPEQPEHTCLPS